MTSLDVESKKQNKTKWKDIPNSRKQIGGFQREGDGRGVK